MVQSADIYLNIIDAEDAWYNITLCWYIVGLY